MSTPRPTEADVEALVEVIVGHQRIPTYRANGQRCSGCDHLRDETDGANSPRHARHVAEQILASDWLAARDAEHQREVKALRVVLDETNQMYVAVDKKWGREIDHRVTAERDRDEARRELADLRGRVAGLADEWHREALDEPQYDCWLDAADAAARIRALLPTEDDQ